MTGRVSETHDVAFEYVCGSGHSLGSRKALSSCPLALCKHPELTRIGRGSGKERKAARGARKAEDAVRPAKPGKSVQQDSLFGDARS